MSLEVQLRRNKIIESRHEINALVMTAAGEVTNPFSNKHSELQNEIFPRSAIKFAQALCFVQSGAIEKFQLTEKHIAIACASHHAQKFHTDLVREWLATMNESENTLECGTHFPADEQTSHAMIKMGELASALHNNCSGKHAGMIAACKALGIDHKGYSDYHHPIQKKIRQILSQISDFDFQNAKWGIDGCAIPTYPVTLQVMARMMTAFLPQRKNHEYTKEAAIIVSAIQKHPEYISATDGYCTRIIRTTLGRILAKTGAEGVYIAIDLKNGQVLALKAKDGQTRASRAALLWIMQDLNWINQSEFEALKPIALPDLQNWSGQVVGDTVVISSDIQHP